MRVGGVVGRLAQPVTGTPVKRGFFTLMLPEWPDVALNTVFAWCWNDWRKRREEFDAITYDDVERHGATYATTYRPNRGK